MAITPAVEQLARQVQRLYPGATATYGDKDGIGFYRSVTFDPKTSKALLPILQIIDDARISSCHIVGKGRSGRLVVVAVSDTRADHRTPFPIEAVSAVLNG